VLLIAFIFYIAVKYDKPYTDNKGKRTNLFFLFELITQRDMFN